MGAETSPSHEFRGGKVAGNSLCVVLGRREGGKDKVTFHKGRKKGKEEEKRVKLSLEYSSSRDNVAKEGETENAAIRKRREVEGGTKSYVHRREEGEGMWEYPLLG